MSSKQIRIALRGMHLVLGALIGLFIYVPGLRAEAAFITLVQLLVVPLLALSGIAMWQMPRINKLRSAGRRTH